MTGAQVYSTNVLNTYKDGDKYLIASSSIPSYNSQALNTTYRIVTFSGTFSGEELLIGEHSFRTGDAVWYAPNIIEQTYVNNITLETETRFLDGTQLFDKGLYFVKE